METSRTKPISKTRPWQAFLEVVLGVFKIDFNWVYGLLSRSVYFLWT